MFDINTTIQWDSTSDARYVLYLELVAPYQWQVYEFPKGVYAGEDLVWTIAGNEEFTGYSCVRASDGDFVGLVGDGTCNDSYHTQFVCGPPDHMRFFYGTHESSRLGGAYYLNDWNGSSLFSGYRSGSTTSCIGNWDGIYNLTPHGVYIR